MLRKTGAAVGFIFNPQNRLCGSRLEALWASKLASPTQGVDFVNTLRPLTNLFFPFGDA